MGRAGMRRIEGAGGVVAVGSWQEQGQWQILNNCIMQNEAQAVVKNEAHIMSQDAG